MKRRHIVLLPEALTDLRWIYDTIEIAAGNVTAIRYIERIEAYCQGLDYASERGTRRDDLRPGLRVVGFERRVTVTFTVESDQVVIFRVFYGGANWEDEL
ncbi:type II toxin-antitoxin system RelE/ParE family toxin [Mesorhizobium sp. M7A.F.Ca.US.010.02.1.1]|uniref:type II toxin-antitoxin system RelE/ParE family toxin n=1 Tax=unclassified Mesorhizobium TaxID=325217 RepID=UPI000FD39C6C|nr:type II toxin-antitoxin system RelE/ParE family toxin [Mesorhizobium sp. M7A.F.Ca.US.010.02.1.1]RUW94016.1 type II toxin-antitoxin system RelE/ParE family toxin [Mesorhizobium sp. M7A.F.Ca.US.010.02.1.1]